MDKMIGKQSSYKMKVPHGKLQIRKAVDDLKPEIHKNIRELDSLITSLYSADALMRHDKEKLDKHQEYKQIVELKEHLLTCITQDTSGSRAETFLSILENSNEGNQQLAKVIHQQADNYLEGLLEVNELLVSVLVNHNEKIVDRLENVEDILNKLFSDEVTMPLWTGDELQNLSNNTRTDKIKKVLHTIEGSTIRQILRFVEIVGQSGANTILYQDLVGCEKYRNSEEKLEEVLEEMKTDLQANTENNLKFQNTVTGQPLHVEALNTNAVSTLLRLNGHMTLAKPPALPTAAAGNSLQRSNSIRNTEFIQDVDILFTENGKAPRITLVEGNPGTGKTVFLKRWARDWASKKHSSSSIVLYIPIRRVKSNKLLDVIFEDLKIVSPKYKIAFEYFLSDPKFAEKFVFLFDGIDEKYYPGASQESEIASIMKGELFKSSKIVMASRMYQNVIRSIKPYIDATVTLTGITNDSRDKFIRQMLGAAVDNDQSMIDTFMVKCESYLFESSIFTVPIYLCLLCELATNHWKMYSSWKDIHIPRTRLNLYLAFTDVFKKIFLNRQGISDNESRDSQHVVDNIETLLFLMGRMSFDGLCKDNYVFTEQDLRKYHIEKRLVQNLGLFIEETNNHNGENIIEYSFCHKTFQEYFSGRYIAEEGFVKTIFPTIMRSREDSWKHKRILAGFESVLKGHTDISTEIKPDVCQETTTMEEMLHPLTVALQFASGITDRIAKDIFLFGTHACDIHIDVTRVNCKELNSYDSMFPSIVLYECQNTEVIEYFVEFLMKANKVNREIVNVLPSSYNQSVYTYLGMEISPALKCKLLHNLYGIEASVFSSENEENVLWCGSEEEIPDMLLAQLTDKDMHHNKIEVSGQNVNLMTLTQLINNSKDLEILELSNTDMQEFSPNQWEEFMTSIKQLKCLSHIGFPFCNLQGNHFRDILEFVKSSVNVECLDVSGNNINNMNDWSRQVLLQLQQESLAEVILEDNFVKEITCEGNIQENKVIKLDNAYVTSLMPFMGNESKLKKFRAHRCSLQETKNHDLWQRVLKKVKTCPQLKNLQFNRCKLNKDFHILELQHLFSELHIEHLDLAYNKLDEVSNGVWQKLLDSIVKHILSLSICSCSIAVEAHLNSLTSRVKAMTNLVKLDISRNHFGKLGNDVVCHFVSALSDLTKLQHLNISDNSLSGKHMLKLSSSLACMESLFHLDISKSGLGCLTEEDWEEFVKNMEACIEIRHLSLSNCKLATSKHISGLTRILYTSALSLAYINLSHNNLQQVPEDVWHDFCQNICNCRKITHFDISYCSLESEMFLKQLTSHIDKLQILEDLLLDHNNFSSVCKEIWKKFSEAFTKTNIGKLQMQKCHISYSPLYICDQQVHITVLELPHNDLGTMDIIEWQIFMDQLEKCKTVSYLKLSKNFLRDVHIPALGKAVRKLTQLKFLNLDENYFNNVQEYQWRTFLTDVANCKMLIKLALSKCHLNAKYHISTIGELIPKLKELEHLDISDNNLMAIDDHTLVKFIDGVKQCKKLDKLNLGKCKLENKFHFEILGNAFPNLLKLKRLNMNGNSFRNVDADLWSMFVKNLKTCKQLEKLNFSDCGLNQAHYWDTLGPMLMTLPRLSHLVLSGNDVVSIRRDVCARFKANIENCGQLTQFSLPCRGSGGRKLSWNEREDKTMSELMEQWH